jgi:tRNA 2-(methylsulfanyl)-N6-isopentenyladenosine37 hydroxylase
MTIRLRTLPLQYRTPPAWADQVLAQPLELLNDHAHLERKAAGNALDLLPRWPQSQSPKRWVQVMIGVAKDEIAHFGTVVKLLEKRGGELTRTHNNSYATELRKLVRLGRGKEELLDRLLISALIEVRSAERFELLAQAAKDLELKKIYRSLWASEHGHFKVFIELAADILPKAKVSKRWQEVLDLEAQIIQAEPPGPKMHSGFQANERCYSK